MLRHCTLFSLDMYFVFFYIIKPLLLNKKYKLEIWFWLIEIKIKISSGALLYACEEMWESLNG